MTDYTKHQIHRAQIIRDLYRDCVAAIRDGHGNRAEICAGKSEMEAASVMFAAIVTKYPGELVIAPPYGDEVSTASEP